MVCGAGPKGNGTIDTRLRRSFQEQKADLPRPTKGVVQRPSVVFLIGVLGMVTSSETVPHRPEYRLFDSAAVGTATFICPPAGAILLAINYVRLGKAGRGVLAVVLGLIVVALEHPGEAELENLIRFFRAIGIRCLRAPVLRSYLVLNVEDCQGRPRRCCCTACGTRRPTRFRRNLFWRWPRNVGDLDRRGWRSFLPVPTSDDGIDWV